MPVYIVLLLVKRRFSQQKADVSRYTEKHLKMNHWKYTNDLIHSSSPYLLQHAHNPVNWRPWSDDLTEQAKREDRLILISIGYAACHWCHVMEHESFEDEEVAEVMNGNYICVKVDREERPDVDHYYMTAVQLMQGQGGWPLNVIALPDGRPVWGGTYFRKETWIQTIKTVAAFYAENREKTVSYAGELRNSIGQVLSGGEIPQEERIIEEKIVDSVSRWADRFDLINGGRKGHPKFPLPVNLQFLMEYGWWRNDSKVLDFVQITLEKMARGGIYDQAGGGFARYSVDEFWKVPHFEKMLYDNGQLLSIYSRGFQLFRKNEFRQVVYETTDFLEREMMHPEGAFYSSLDADSEGEEGRFYLWKKQELQELLMEDFELFSKFFNINQKGHWENGNYILLRDVNEETFARENNIPEAEFSEKVRRWKAILMNVRDSRARPGLDDKTLTSWNALVISGLSDAAEVFNDDRFVKLALKNAHFLKNNMMNDAGALMHVWKNGNATIPGFLEDYALLSSAFLRLFEVTGDKQWLFATEKMNLYTLSKFYDHVKGYYWFTEKDRSGVIANHLSLEDHVIPGANSVMAENLYKLYLISGSTDYFDTVLKMNRQIFSSFAAYPMAYANWGRMILRFSIGGYEVAVCGRKAQEMTRLLRKEYRPDVLWVFTEQDSEIPIFRQRTVGNKTVIYVCREGVCGLPVENVKDAIRQLTVNPV